MQRYKKIYFLSICLVLLVISQVNAFSIITDDNYYDSTYLNNRIIYGTFDINQQLSGYNLPYDINSAYVTFTFFDDNDSKDIGPYYTRYNQTNTYKENSILYSKYVRSYYNQYYDDSDFVDLSIAGQLIEKHTDFYEVTTFRSEVLDYFESISPYMINSYLYISVRSKR